MSRRSEQQIKQQLEAQGVPTVNSPNVKVPQEQIDQAKAIRAALKAGKELCHGCLRIFDTAHGLKVHAYHCKGK